MRGALILSIVLAGAACSQPRDTPARSRVEALQAKHECFPARCGDGIEDPSEVCDGAGIRRTAASDRSTLAGAVVAVAG